MRTARWLGTAAVVALAMLPAGVGRADGGWPVAVDNLTEEPIRVELAAGDTAPCDSSSNVALFSGLVAPGTRLELASPLAQVCFRRTYEPFGRVDWSPARFVAVPVECHGYGKRRTCRPAPDPTIRIVFPPG